MALTLIKGGALDTQPKDIDHAWESYAELTRAAVDDPKLLYDRGFVERQRRAYQSFIKLFDAKERRA